MNPYIATLSTLALIYRAYIRNSLTPRGILAATLTAIAHALHPWSVFFALLAVFFLAGTAVTKVKADVKAGLTVSASATASSSAAPGRDSTQVGSETTAPPKPRVSGDISQGENTAEPQVASAKAAQKAHAHPRNATQVLSNSLPATLALLTHTLYLHAIALSVSQLQPVKPHQTCLPPPPSLAPLLSTSSGTTDGTSTTVTGPGSAFPNAPTMDAPDDRLAWHAVMNLLPYAVLAHYASAAADTFSSELGILASSSPVLVTSVFTAPVRWMSGGGFGVQRVPRGTNGGVTAFGLLAGLGGAAVVGAVSVAFMPFCSEWSWTDKLLLFTGISLIGAMGSALDSLLGAWFQASVVEVGSGRVVEDAGGGKIKTHGHGAGGKQGVKGEGWKVVGKDWLSNNGINLLMCSVMSLVGMGVAGVWGGAVR